MVRLVLLVWATALATAAEYPPPVEGDHVIQDFRFASGETLPELKLHYRTVGVPSRNNAVLVLHGTGGSGKQFLTEQFAGVLFGPDQLLDARQYFIVLPDGIGHGESAKPSDGLRAQFPRYVYEDMVRAQYRLLTEHLGVHHLRLVMGTSMGGMQTWMWGEMYPEFMDALMPLASLPVEIAGRNRMTRRMIIDAIRDDPGWNHGAYKEQPRGLRAALDILMILVSAPREWQRRYPSRDRADRYLEEWIAARMKTTDANDLLYAVDASRDYNPAPGLEHIRAPLVAVNSADDQVNPPELGVMEREMSRVKRGRYVLLPVSDETRGHGTHSLPAVWKEHLARLLAESSQ